MDSSSSALAPKIGTGGLRVTILPASVYNGTLTSLPISFVVVVQNKTNFIYLNTSSDTLAVNQTGFPSTNCYPIAIAVVGVTDVLQLTDSRPDFWLAGGSGGGSSVSTNYTNIKTNTTTVVKSGSGSLAQIQVNNPGSGWTMTIYDNTAGSGTLIGTTTAISALAGGTLIYTTTFNTGLTIVTAGTTAGDLTVSWS
jgi:hypothetical protein